MTMMMTILCNLSINTLIWSQIFPCNEEPNSPDRVLSRIYGLGQKSQVAEGDKLPRGSGGLPPPPPPNFFEMNMR